ncbi:hypothetical protein K490DRAFT_53646 [Saccharata proteae CBS 121410]|uniref:Uncharacterized protein n=1 Tax=Saccharata proteae CBS 121410 TaxID=1314787 RepID=A0A9P4LYU7_9PEZI|nr:hypothetical protein K490DRAFT_53646 [Saccharata proteae CBS 121410]
MWSLAFTLLWLAGVNALPQVVTAGPEIETTSLPTVTVINSLTSTYSGSIITPGLATQTLLSATHSSTSEFFPSGIDVTFTASSTTLYTTSTVFSTATYTVYRSDDGPNPYLDHYLSCDIFNRLDCLER